MPASLADEGAEQRALLVRVLDESTREAERPRQLAAGATCALFSDAGVRLTEGTVVRVAPKMGRKALPVESPTARSDVRVREVFVEIPATSKLIPGQRVWGHTSRPTTARGTSRSLSNGG